MRRLIGGVSLAVVLGSVAGCELEDAGLGPGASPAEPNALEAHYYAGAVHVSWELSSRWDGDAFRVYSRRVSDSEYFLIAPR